MIKLKKDNIAKEYMNDNKIFSNVFNYYLYNGKNVIKPENLVSLDSTSVINSKNESIQRHRDLIKCLKDDDNNTYLLLGIENQTSVDYNMIFRTLHYDSMSYMEQIERKNKNDIIRLKPVITLVIYYGSKNWSGPRSLYEALNITNNPIRKFIPDYKLNIIVPNELNDEDFNKLDDLGYVLELIKNSKDRNKMEVLINEKDGYKRLSSKGSLLLNYYLDLNIDIDETKEEFNMCKAFEDQRKLGIKEGIEQGKIEGKIEGKNESIVAFYKNGVSIELISKSLNISIDEIKTILRNNNIEI